MRLNIAIVRHCGDHCDDAGDDSNFLQADCEDGGFGQLQDNIGTDQRSNAMRFAIPRREESPHCEELDGNPFAETAEEEEEMSNDETASETGEVNPSSSSRAEITEADVEAPAMRHRALPLASEKTTFFLKKTEASQRVCQTSF